jgi:hypothetical protein
MDLPSKVKVRISDDSGQGTADRKANWLGRECYKSGSIGSERKPRDGDGGMLLGGGGA